MKQVNGATMVLIQWRNFPIERATWEPANKFENADSLIQ